MLLVLSACVPQLDMQGVNPQEYYAEHPIENSVEIRHAVHTMTFAAGTDRLTGDAIDALQMALVDATPTATESVTVSLAPAQMGNDKRKEHISKLLRSMGYARKQITFEAAKDTKNNTAEVDVTYAEVVSPHCPDWRTSPVTTYSNSQQGGNIGCASVVNLGRMVADPHDLVKGVGEVSPDSARNAAVISGYKKGVDLGTGSGSSSSSTGNAGDSTATATQ
jgi:pilus biogenesis lipoprotein CpaD